MLAGLLRSAGGPSAQSGPLQLLLQQGATACQGLTRWESCVGVSLDSCDSRESVSTPSTSASWSPLHHQAGARQHLQHPLQAQQLRFYRIPNKVLLPKVPYSVRSGRASPQPSPALEALKAAPGELRWHRSVVRFPAEVTAEIQGAAEGAEGAGGSSSSSGRVLAISGKAGTIRLNLEELDPTGLLAFRLINLPPAAGAAAGSSGRSLLVLASPDKGRFEAVGAELNKAIRGVMAGYLLGLTVKGVGYRMEPVEEGAEGRRGVGLSLVQQARRSRDPNGGTPKPYYFEPVGSEKQNINFPYNKPASAVRLKVGYSRTAVYPLPPHIRAFFLKPTLLYLYGLELDELTRVAAEIRGIRKPNPYTGNGVQYVDEVVKLKARKGGK